MRANSLLATVGLLLFAAIAYGQPIEIKGLSIGMPKAEVEALFPSWAGFTIAGVKSAEGFAPVARYHDDKLDVFHFIFSAKDFDAVAEAVKEKYPSTECVDSKVSNAMGTTFRQTHCNITNDPLAVLRLSRFVKDVNTSMLTLTSMRFVKEGLEKRRERKKDI